MRKKRSSQQEIQARLLAAQAKPVKLRVAASVVHNELTRQGRFNLRGPDYIVALNQAAAELANIVDVYHVAGGKLLRVPADEIAGGEFMDGGNLLRSASGTVYRALSVRRVDVLEGLEALRTSRKALDAAAQAPKVPEKGSD